MEVEIEGPIVLASTQEDIETSEAIEEELLEENNAKDQDNLEDSSTAWTGKDVTSLEENDDDDYHTESYQLEDLFNNKKNDN